MRTSIRFLVRASFGDFLYFFSTVFFLFLVFIAYRLFFSDKNAKFIFLQAAFRNIRLSIGIEGDRSNLEKQIFDICYLHPFALCTLTHLLSYLLCQRCTNQPMVRKTFEHAFDEMGAFGAI